MKKPSGQDRTASEWNYVARATRRRRRILQSRILSCFIGNTVIHLCVKVEPSYEIKNAPRGCVAQIHFIKLLSGNRGKKSAYFTRQEAYLAGMTMEKGITELDGRSICIDGDIGEVLAQL